MNKKWGYAVAIIAAVLVLLFAGGRLFSFFKKNNDTAPEYVLLYAENQIEDYIDNDLNQYDKIDIDGKNQAE